MKLLKSCNEVSGRAHLRQVGTEAGTGLGWWNGCNQVEGLTGTGWSFIRGNKAVWPFTRRNPEVEIAERHHVRAQGRGWAVSRCRGRQIGKLGVLKKLSQVGEMGRNDWSEMLSL